MLCQLLVAKRVWVCPPQVLSGQIQLLCSLTVREVTPLWPSDSVAFKERWDHCQAQCFEEFKRERKYHLPYLLYLCVFFFNFVLHKLLDDDAFWIKLLDPFFIASLNQFIDHGSILLDTTELFIICGMYAMGSSVIVVLNQAPSILERYDIQTTLSASFPRVHSILSFLLKSQEKFMFWTGFQDILQMSTKHNALFYI